MTENQNLNNAQLLFKNSGVSMPSDSHALAIISFPNFFGGFGNYVETVHINALSEK